MKDTEVLLASGFFKDLNYFIHNKKDQDRGMQLAGQEAWKTNFKVLKVFRVLTKNLKVLMTNKYKRFNNCNYLSNKFMPLILAVKLAFQLCVQIKTKMVTLNLFWEDNRTNILI